MPNVQQDELVRLVGQTAVLRFRAVYAAEQVQPPEPAPTATSEPTQGATAPPSGEPTAAPSQTAEAPPGEPSAQRDFATTSRCPLCLLRPGPLDKACVPAEACGNSAWQGVGVAAHGLPGIRGVHLPKPVTVPDQGMFACNGRRTRSTCSDPP